MYCCSYNFYMFNDTLKMYMMIMMQRTEYIHKILRPCHITRKKLKPLNLIRMRQLY